MVCLVLIPSDAPRGCRGFPIGTQLPSMVVHHVDQVRARVVLSSSDIVPASSSFWIDVFRLPLTGRKVAAYIQRSCPRWDLLGSAVIQQRQQVP